MDTDIEFLGLTAGDGPGHFHFTVENHLARLDGLLYGGTAIAVSIATAEALTNRSPLWMTTQFIATAPANERISVHTEVLAPGRRTNQVRVTGTDAAGDIMFASLGATGHHKESGLAGTFDQAPTVSPPERSEPWPNPFVAVVRNAGIEADFSNFPTDLGFNAALDFREPTVEAHPDPGPGRMCVGTPPRSGCDHPGDCVVRGRHGAALSGPRLRCHGRWHQLGQHDPHRGLRDNRVGAHRPSTTPGGGRLWPRDRARLVRVGSAARHGEPDILDDALQPN